MQMFSNLGGGLAAINSVKGEGKRDQLQGAQNTIPKN